MVRTRASSAVGAETKRVLAGECVGDGVRDGAGGAGASGVGEPVLERVALGGALESAVLVEEAGVEVEDAFADEVEAEVPGLDHAGMDGPTATW